jgi:hypothetical protein
MCPHWAQQWKNLLQKPNDESLHKIQVLVSTAPIFSYFIQNLAVYLLKSEHIYSLSKVKEANYKC